jgi:hypothetical protein
MTCIKGRDSNEASISVVKAQITVFAQRSVKNGLQTLLKIRNERLWAVGLGKIFDFPCQKTSKFLG